MEYLSEDPTYLAGGLGILALAFLVALRVTQQGKYLIWAVAALGLAGVVLIIERAWVTDAERIEAVVYDLRRAVAASDAKGVLDHLTPDVRYAPGGNVRYLKGTNLNPVATRVLMQSVENTRFDFVRVTSLTTHAGEQSRRGTAEFRIIAGGSITSGGTRTTSARPASRPVRPGRSGSARPARRCGWSTASRPYRCPTAPSGFPEVKILVFSGRFQPAAFRHRAAG